MAFKSNSTEAPAAGAASCVSGAAWFWLTVAIAAAGLAGCNNAPSVLDGGGPRLVAPIGTISVYQLAGRLDLKVAESSSGSAMLRGPGNLVMLFADPGGQAYVNGRAVAPEGGIVPVSGILFVPERFERAIRVALRPAPPKPKPHKPNKRWLWGGRQPRVVIDAGHGGKDPGAVSLIGIYEKSVNLSVALLVAGKLRAAGVDVVMTRRDDRFIELNERAAIANRVGAKLFVSIHADSSSNRSAHGFSAYVSRSASAKSQAAAKLILQRMAGGGANNRGTHRANFRVLVRTSCPAVLVELGYLSNRAEAMRLNRGDYQELLAKAICLGIVDFLKRH